MFLRRSGPARRRRPDSQSPGSGLRTWHSNSCSESRPQVTVTRSGIQAIKNHAAPAPLVLPPLRQYAEPVQSQHGASTEPARSQYRASAEPARSQYRASTEPALRGTARFSLAVLAPTGIALAHCAGSLRSLRWLIALIALIALAHRGNRQFASRLHSATSQQCRTPRDAV
jgi:hypothetical protein